MIIHEINASKRASRSIVDGWIASPVAAKSQVDDDVVGTKMAGYVTVRIWEVCRWRAPEASVDKVQPMLYIEGNVRVPTRPEPNIDIGSSSFDSKPSTATCVELWSKAVRCVVEYGATTRVKVGGYIAVCGKDRSKLMYRFGNRTVSASMESSLIWGHIVDALQDIDFTLRCTSEKSRDDRGTPYTLWPPLFQCFPNSRPGPTPLWHVP